MTETLNAITVNRLEKSFKNLKVLNNIDFTVAKGTIFALLGSNGAGKTTMIKILTTLLKSDSGKAQICGFDVVKESDKVRDNISLTGQFTAVDDIQTGRENLRMIGKLRHLMDVNKKVDVLLAQFDLTDAADRRCATYSGGMRRRLDLAMSLLGEPRVLFLDEPTTGLDPQGRLAMWKIIKNLAKSGITIFLTTQYLDEADQLADQIAILNGGKIVTQGSPSDLKKLLPHGHIELKFRDDKELKSASDLMKGYNIAKNDEELSLSITTNGTIKEMTDILLSCENAGLTVTEFAQKMPTLEDVFLSIIGKNQERKII